MTSSQRICLFLFLLGLLLLVGVCQSKADSIPAEEIEVPPPTWSIFYEGEPEPEPLPPVFTPIEIEGPLISTLPPPDMATPATAGGGVPPGLVGAGVGIGVISFCWIPGLCGNGGNGGDGGGGSPPFITPPPPPPKFPTAPVPEPGAFLVFAVGLLLLSRRNVS